MAKLNKKERFFDCYCFLFVYSPFFKKCITNTHLFKVKGVFLTLCTAKLVIYFHKTKKISIKVRAPLHFSN